jgi:hypothetical protein
VQIVSTLNIAGSTGRVEAGCAHVHPDDYLVDCPNQPGFALNAKWIARIAARRWMRFAATTLGRTHEDSEPDDLIIRLSDFVPELAQAWIAAMRYGLDI